MHDSSQPLEKTLGYEPLDVGQPDIELAVFGQVDCPVNDVNPAPLDNILALTRTLSESLQHPSLL